MGAAGRYRLVGASYKEAKTGDIVQLTPDDAERLAKAFEPVEPRQTKASVEAPADEA